MTELQRRRGSYSPAVVLRPRSAPPPAPDIRSSSTYSFRSRSSLYAKHNGRAAAAAHRSAGAGATVPPLPHWTRPVSTTARAANDAEKSIADTYTHTQARTLTHKHKHTHTYTHKHKHTHTYTHKHTQAHVHTHTHTHKHTYTQHASVAIYTRPMHFPRVALASHRRHVYTHHRPLVCLLHRRREYRYRVYRVYRIYLCIEDGRNL